MEKHGTTLEGKWRCEKAKDDQQILCEILNFLMDSNVKLSYDMLRKTQSCERMKLEADKCLEQSRQFKDAKRQFENDVFEKFVAVLNAKKAKLREVRDKLARFEPSRSASQRGRENDTDNETDDKEGEDNEDDESIDTIEKNEEEEGRAAKGDGVTDSAGTADIPKEVGDKESKVPTMMTRAFRGEAASDTGHFEEPSNSEVVNPAAALLADSTYTSAPRRRRHL